jgi:hypothetical protein
MFSGMQFYLTKGSHSSVYLADALLDNHDSLKTIKICIFLTLILQFNFYFTMLIPLTPNSRMIYLGKADGREQEIETVMANNC